MLSNIFWLQTFCFPACSVLTEAAHQSPWTESLLARFVLACFGFFFGRGRKPAGPSLPFKAETNTFNLPQLHKQLRPGNICRSWGQILCHYPREESLKAYLSSSRCRYTHMILRDGVRHFTFAYVMTICCFFFAATSFRKPLVQWYRRLVLASWPLFKGLGLSVLLSEAFLLWLVFASDWADLGFFIKAS